jgi:CRP-like cAMP-binding protein
MDPPATIDHLVRHARLFSCLNEEQLAQVTHSMRVLKLQEGERLFDFGQNAERFFLVTKGHIKLFRLSAEGKEKVVQIAGPDRMFAIGVMFMERRYYPVSAMALESSEVCSFDSQTFLNLLRNSTDLCLTMLGEMSMHLHALINEIDQLALQNATFRIVSYLNSLLPDPDAERSVIDLSAPKKVIASRLSIKPETFSRILRGLASEGIITVDGRIIEVHDPRRLRKFGQ